MIILCNSYIYLTASRIPPGRAGGLLAWGLGTRTGRNGRTRTSWNGKWRVRGHGWDLTRPGTLARRIFKIFRVLSRFVFFYVFS